MPPSKADCSSPVYLCRDVGLGCQVGSIITVEVSFTVIKWPPMVHALLAAILHALLHEATILWLHHQISKMAKGGQE